ncbi:MAG: NHLP leader peptide family RiPP precursor [Opitutales bacterium]|nr:NHLP leader peptide family RiPP precursor [Opitutales bacterium]MCH8539645.1 NHLP leader peptide family RiPP precursor [Opitutales bacterium]
MPNTLIYKDEINQILAALATQARKDPTFKERLLTDPKALLREKGIDLPESLRLKIVEDTDPHLITLHLPPAPSEDLTDEELEAVSGGGTEVKDLETLFPCIKDIFNPEAPPGK